MSTAPARARFAALGTSVELLVTEPDALAAATTVLRADLAALDLACSRFRPDSDLAAANRAAGHPVPVGSLLREAVRVALVAAAQTDGDVDPTLGRCLRELGYDRDLSALPADGPAEASGPAPRHGAWRRVEVDDTLGTVRIPLGTELDLGATAKALGADRAAARIAARTGSGALVNLGGDIATAGPPPDGGWRVRVRDHPDSEHPAVRRRGAPAQTVVLTGGGLATSSTVVRTWTRGGVGHHHLLDPRTGRPVPSRWRTVTVTAATCTDANTASTAAVVRGAAAPAWLEGVGLPARLVGTDDRVVTVGGWPHDPSGAPRVAVAS